MENHFIFSQEFETAVLAMTWHSQYVIVWWKLEWEANVWQQILWLSCLQDKQLDNLRPTLLWELLIGPDQKQYRHSGVSWKLT